MFVRKGFILRTVFGFIDCITMTCTFKKLGYGLTLGFLRDGIEEMSGRIVLVLLGLFIAGTLTLSYCMHFSEVNLAIPVHDFLLLCNDKFPVSSDAQIVSC
jgi:hypothetical protein